MGTRRANLLRWQQRVDPDARNRNAARDVKQLGAAVTAVRGGGDASGLASRIAKNAGTWGLSKRVAIALFAIPLPALPVAIVLSLTNQPWFYRITDEDQLVEWLQVVVLLIASGAFLLLTRRHWRDGRRISAVISILLAVGAFVVVGEEISWGQRILGWATPPTLDAINEQGETNIHNIKSIATTSRLTQFVASGYGFLVPLVTLLPKAPRRVTESFFVPPVAVVSFFAGTFAYWAVRIPLDPTPAIFQISEITELTSYSGLAVLGIVSLHRLRAAAGGPRPTGDALSRPKARH